MYYSSHDRHQGPFKVGRRTHKLSPKSLTGQRSIGFPNVSEVFQVLSKRNRPISRATDVTTTPAPSKGPHLVGPAYPPAAVRAGTVGKLSETNDFLFFS